MAAEFLVVGYTEQGGKKVKRRYQATSVQEAQAFARAEHVLPVKVTRQNEFFVTRVHRDTLPYSILRSIHISITAQLESGQSVLQAVTNLSRSMTHKKARRVMGGLRAVLEGEGSRSDLASAMASYPRIWPQNVCAMISAGERNPKDMPEMFRQVNAYNDEMRALRNLLVERLTMPAISIVLGFGVLLLMIFFTLPRMADFFKDLGIHDLPWITSTLIVVGKWIQRNLTELLLGVGGVSTIAVIAYLTGTLTRLAWFVSGYVPVLSEMLRMQALARYATVFGAIHSATKRIDDALSYAAAALSVPKMRRVALVVADENKSKATDMVEGLRRIPGFDEALANTLAPESARSRVGFIFNAYKPAYIETAKYLGGQLATMVSLVALAIITGMVVVCIVAYGAPMLRMLESAGKQ